MITFGTRGLTLLAMLFCALCAHAQNCDTRRTTHTTLLAQLQNANIFDRSSRWSAGGNWGCFSTRAANTLFGLSLNDNTVGSASGPAWGLLGHMNLFSEPLRLIPIEYDRVIFFNQGFGIGTRIDPELTVNSYTNVVAAETGVNTGAAHTFAVGSAGYVTSGAKYRSFRKDSTAHRAALSGNTNATVMTHSYNTNLEYTHTLSVDSTVRYQDPGQTGEMLWVGITARRVGAVVNSGASTDTVLKLVVRRQRLRKPLEERVKLTCKGLAALPQGLPFAVVVCCGVPRPCVVTLT